MKKLLRFGFALAVEHIGEHRDESRRQRAFSQEAAQQIGDLKGRVERVRDQSPAKIRGHQRIPGVPQNPREQRGRTESAQLAGEGLSIVYV